ncbi:MAG: hypothetical protein IPH04_19915 [Saprospirales bacterium]|nr:hypothetical protein [Saprospirales bacterium]
MLPTLCIRIRIHFVDEGQERLGGAVVGLDALGLPFVFEGDEGGGKIRYFLRVFVGKGPEIGFFEFLEEQVGLFRAKGLGIGADLFDKFFPT